MKFQPEDCIFYQLAKAGQAGARYWTGYVSEYNITATQAMVLNFLGLEDCVSPRDLAERTRLDRATLTGIIDRLETGGHVERMPHPEDRRAQLIGLTENGRELARHIYTRMIEANKDFLEVLDSEERRMLKKLLGKIRRAAEVAEPG